MALKLDQRINEAFQSALKLEESARSEFVTGLRAESIELADAVAAKLAKYEAFLQNPAHLPAEETVVAPEEDQLSKYDTVPVTRDYAAQRGAPAAQPKVAEPALVAEDYELLEQIGAGGMGVVYKAYQHSLRRHVALKIIPERYLRTPEQVARFQIEAEAAARLDHPGIVPVYEIGERFGVHYYSMALVDGDNLAAYMPSERRLPPRRCAEIIEQVARAVQYAHDRAVIHRDLKPANIMLERDGRPRLTDFGLAKVLKDDENFTRTEQTVGTPSYMAPEQAIGKQKELSNRTDVYSLGATLYALLAGRPPFEGKSIYDTIRQVIDTNAPPLVGVDADLATICAKCLAKRPVDRYESAQAMAEDLRNYLDGYPISARRLGWGMRGYLWCRRNPAVAALLAITATTLIAGTVVSTVFGIEAQRQLVRAERNLQTLDEALEELFVGFSENRLADVPGMEEVRQTLLTSAQRYYQRLLATGDISPQKFARSTLLLGQIHALLGNSDAAIASYDTALAHYRALVAAHPDDAQLLAALARTHNEYAKIYASHPQTDATQVAKGLEEWRSHAEECAAYRLRAVQASRDDAERHELNRLLANALMNLGLVVTEFGPQGLDPNAYAEADALYIQAQALRQELLNTEPRDGKVLSDVALGLVSQADLRVVQARAADDAEVARGLFEASLELRTRAAEKLEQLPSEAATSETDSLLSSCHQICGESLFDLGRLDEALVQFDRAQQTWQQLVLRNPRVVRSRVGLADVLYNTALVLLTSGKEEGLDKFNACQETLVEAIAIDPGNGQAVDKLVDYSRNFAQGFAERGSLEQGLAMLERAKSLLANIKTRGEGKSAVDDAIRRLEQAADEIREQHEQTDQVAG